MTSTDDFIPPAITRRAEELGNTLGHYATVTRMAEKRWRIAVTSPRVEVTVDYKPLNRGRVQQVGSTLAIDGKPCALARDFDHLVAIFADPGQVDAAAEGGVPALTVPTTEPPTEIRALSDALLKRLPDRLANAVRVGRVDGAWAVGVDHERFNLRIRFATELTTKPGRARYDLDRIQVWVDGVDRSDEVQDKLDAALDLIFATGETTPAAPAIRAESAAKVNTSVQVRRQTVIRV